MNLVKIEAGAVAAYPYSLKQFRRDNPDVLCRKNPGAKTLREYGVHEVSPSAKPTPGDDEVIEESGPVLKGARWYQGWAVRSYTKQEKKAIEARELQRVNNGAENAVARYNTTPAHAAKAAEARAYLVSPVGEFPFLTAEAAATGKDITALAAEIAAAADKTDAALAAIEAARVSARASIRNAPTVKAKESAAAVDWTQF